MIMIPFLFSINNFIYLYHSFLNFIYKYYIKFDHDVVKKKERKHCLRMKNFLLKNVLSRYNVSIPSSI